MNGLFSFQTVIFTCIALFGLQSCGLHYTPDLSIEDFNMQRRLVLENQLKKDYSTLGKSYYPITYGDPVVIKPISYKRLDTLFQKKYTATKLGQSTAELDLLIESQQQVIQNDTNKIRYMETHWFELVQDTIHEYITAECVLTKTNELDEMRILDYFSTTSKDTSFARKFCTEKAFISNGYIGENGQLIQNEASLAELNFYRLMKEKSVVLIGEEKDAFMQHIFKMMRIATDIQSLGTLKLVAQLSRIQLLTENPNLDLGQITFDISDQKDEFGFTYIEVLVRKTVEKSAFKILKYNAWMEEIKN